VNVPASIRDVSRTSPTRIDSRPVSCSMSARNDSRCSADSSCQRARKVTAQPITEALGALGGVPLGGVCADVLDCGRELAGEQSDQLDFVLAEAVRLFPGDGEDPERLTAER
jgi:hypothetical protein